MRLYHDGAARDEMRDPLLPHSVQGYHYRRRDLLECLSPQHREPERVLGFVKAFIAGFVSTLVFHQGVLTLFYLAGAFPRAPYDLTAVPPLGIPAVISLAFWGGIWGAAIWPVLKHAGGAAYWLRALVMGAIGPSAVALLIVFPLKGMPIGGGWDPKLIVGALVLNGAWGLGLALLMRLMTGARTIR